MYLRQVLLDCLSSQLFHTLDCNPQKLCSSFPGKMIKTKLVYSFSGCALSGWLRSKLPQYFPKSRAIFYQQCDIHIRSVSIESPSVSIYLRPNSLENNAFLGIITTP